MIFPAAFSVLLAAVAVAAPSPQSSPVPQDLINKVHIGNIVMGGSGCPQGSVSAAFSPDNTTMTLIFDNWEAQWYTTPAAAHENCQLNIEIFVPFGIAFFVASIDHRGYALLDSGCTGSVSTTYYFSGETQQATTNLQLTGPLAEDYLKTDTAVGFSAVTSPCGASAMLNINAAVSTICKTKDEVALMTVESEDQKWTQIYHLGWSYCH